MPPGRCPSPRLSRRHTWSRFRTRTRPRTRPEPLTLPRAPLVALEPVPDAHPDPEPRPEPLTLPRAPLVALEPIPDAHPDPEARPAPVHLTETLDAMMRWTGIRALRMLDTALKILRAERAHMKRPIDEIGRAYRQRGPHMQAHADTHGQAPTEDEIRNVEEYLKGGTNAAGSRPGLAQVIDDVATARLDGSEPTKADPLSRELDFRWMLAPHTRERPRQENEYQLDRENEAPCRSVDAARTAARMAAKALDEYQGERYGTDEQGTPRPPPPAEAFPGWTKATREGKRQSRIAETVEHWRREIAPKLLERIRQAIVPLEVQFGRNLKRQRDADRAAAEARRQQMAAVPAQPVQPDRGAAGGTERLRRGGRLATLPGPLRPSRGPEAAAVRPASP